MSENSEESGGSGLDRWWYIAAGVMLAVVIGAVAVVWHGRATPTQAASPASSAPGGAGNTVGGSTAPSTAGDAWVDDRGCAGTTGEAAFDQSALSAVSWQAVGNASAPGSSTLGPVQVDGPVRRCFQHSPAGALVAAVNIISGLGSDHAAQVAVARQQVTDGGWSEQLTTSEDSDSGGGSGPGTVAGYQLGGCEPGSCLVSLAFYGQGIYYTVSLPMVWVEGDWKLSGQSAPMPGRGISSIPQGWTPWTP